MTHDEPDFAVIFSQEFWDDRYRSKEKVWSGNPNPQLVAFVSGLTPGTALDVGSGEGADAIWLAGRGWQVTGVDVSTVALERSARHAAQVGPGVAARITWRQADVRSWDPAPEQFDLVSAQYMHLPRPERDDLHRRLAAAVRPHGTLLVVGHHLADLETLAHRPQWPELMFTEDTLATGLDPAQWEIETTSAKRGAADPDGNPITVQDAILRAIRRP